MNDSFIGDSAVKAAHAINVERGWELPEDIHETHEKEITEACYDIFVECRTTTGAIINMVLKVVVTKSMSNMTNKVSCMDIPYFVVTPVSSHPRWAKVVTCPFLNLKPHGRNFIL